MTPKRISISEILRNDLLKVGKTAILRFDDGSIASLACFDDGEIDIACGGHRQVFKITTRKMRRGSRRYFQFDGKAVAFLYCDETNGFVSRQSADVHYESENLPRPNVIPRKQSPAHAAMVATVLV